MLIHARCTPRHSYTNPAERVMSILNLGLQNCALERKALTEEAEKDIKKCGSVAEIRGRAENDPDFKTNWVSTMEPVQSLVRNRFLKLQLKDRPFQAVDPLTEVEIDSLKRHLR